MVTKMGSDLQSDSPSAPKATSKFIITAVFRRLRHRTPSSLAKRAASLARYGAADSKSLVSFGQFFTDLDESTNVGSSSLIYFLFCFGFIHRLIGSLLRSTSRRSLLHLQTETLACLLLAQLAVLFHSLTFSRAMSNTPHLHKRGPNFCREIFWTRDPCYRHQGC